MAGAFFAARRGLVNPESFTFIESALILAVVVLGGMGSQLGVILAAILLTVLPEVARDFAEYRMLIFGLVMVLMMMWRPQGLLPAKPSPRGVAAMSAEMLKVSGLQMRFGGLLAVDGIDFDVRRDEVFAIIGPNGAGKTTVFNCVGGFYKPTAGKSRWTARPSPACRATRWRGAGWCARFRIFACSSR